MQRHLTCFELGALALVALSAACASPPAPAPASAPSAELPPVEPPPAASVPPPSVPEPSAAPATSAPPVATAPAGSASGPERTQAPVDMLTGREAAFLVDYANCDAKAKAQERCEKESKGDAEKQGACLNKAREQFLPDVIRFKRESETSIVLVIYKRAGSTLREISTGAVTLTPEGADAVRVKFANTKGSRPLWRNQKDAVVRVPNDYSIEIDDPEQGRLRYDAKIGLVAD